MTQLTRPGFNAGQGELLNDDACNATSCWEYFTTDIAGTKMLSNISNA